MTDLTPWQYFYSIAGEAAASLTGLQFISMALIAEVPLSENDAQNEDSGSGSAFSTPSIIQFATVLLIAGVLVMPWHSIRPVSIICMGIGAIGLGYIAHNGWLFTHQTYYKPVLEDILMRLALPLLNYALLLVSGHLLRTHLEALFGIAAVAIICLGIGIHNAWDNVTYLVFMKRKQLRKEPK
jgi:hypothetical protein